MIDRARMEAELEELGYTDARASVRDAVINVLYSLEAQQVTDEDLPIVADLVAALMRKHEPISEIRGRWIPFKLGSVKQGDIVRVRWDAYDSDSGQRHNGLVATFTGAYAGRCTIRYVGRNDRVDFTHPPKLLEVLER